MPRDPNIPDAFDVFTLVLLRRPDHAPEFSESELDALQAAHLAYRAELRRQGVLVVNGPFAQQTDVSLRGGSIFACGLEEAARVNDADPSARAVRWRTTDWLATTSRWSGRPASRFSSTHRQRSCSMSAATWWLLREVG
jgi:uncharacterized protein YciI